jgi:predicted membrane channel-forming protein YqfA (hemolysin III family)
VQPIFLTTFLEVVAWIVIAFFWVLAIWMFIAVFGDIFRRRDLSGAAKALWTVFIFVLPFLGVLIYLITRPAGATREQDLEILAQQRRAMGYSATEEIAKAQQLLAAGTISQQEFDQIKQRALM